jgi:hypothetical protein
LNQIAANKGVTAVIGAGDELPTSWQSERLARSYAGTAVSRPAQDHKSWLYFYLIDVAPPPVFSGFKRLDYRMMGRVKMLGCVLIRRTVAAADVSACKAETQMNPVGANLKTVFTSIR